MAPVPVSVPVSMPDLPMLTTLAVDRFSKELKFRAEGRVAIEPALGAPSLSVMMPAVTPVSVSTPALPLSTVTPLLPPPKPVVTFVPLPSLKMTGVA